ncbi:hypothetical protein BKM31_17640 [[Actinomadura] parvosata subsp. kistnae]|uniref:Uncharacterized protein n=1 Tax=[Actinomadura] parvosata subsp. kistnae TaxID=1909395 RepID=A0A1U9ZYL3_9ACTN|nr:hypothetical protein BKM31_17640 [Nonomuraea sp. ATCC 55076]
MAVGSAVGSTVGVVVGVVAGDWLVTVGTGLVGLGASVRVGVAGLPSGGGSLWPVGLALAELSAGVVGGWLGGAGSTAVASIVRTGVLDDAVEVAVTVAAAVDGGAVEGGVDRTTHLPLTYPS